MFKKIIVYVLMVCSFGLEAFDELPDVFNIDQSTAYNSDHTVILPVRDGEGIHGFIVRYTINNPAGSGKIPLYELYSRKNGLEAVAKVTISDSKGLVVFDINDKEGNLIGIVEEDWRSGSYYPTFELYSSSHDLIAKGYFNSIGHSFTIISSFNEQVMATISSGFTTWIHTVYLEDPELARQMDFRLFLLLNSLSMECYNRHDRNMSFSLNF